MVTARCRDLAASALSRYRRSAKLLTHPVVAKYRIQVPHSGKPMQQVTVCLEAALPLPPDRS